MASSFISSAGVQMFGATSPKPAPASSLCRPAIRRTKWVRRGVGPSEPAQPHVSFRSAGRVVREDGRVVPCHPLAVKYPDYSFLNRKKFARAEGIFVTVIVPP